MYINNKKKLIILFLKVKKITINEKNDIVMIKCPICWHTFKMSSSIAFGEKYNSDNLIIK